ncbi:MAG: SMC-Scp complex subunit ScpB [Candidatus Micrarchaeia archaeon]
MEEKQEGKESRAESAPESELLFLDVPEEPERKEEPSPLRVIEAALFQSSKPLRLEDFARITGIAAPGSLEELLKQLQAEYDQRGSPIQIVCENNLWVMRLRAPYAQKVAEFAKEAEVSKGGLRLLAFVSRNEGVTQAKAVKVLGSTVYDYVNELVESGFITAEKNGRTRALKTTQKFKDYFSG